MPQRGEVEAGLRGSHQLVHDRLSQSARQRQRAAGRESQSREEGRLVTQHCAHGKFRTPEPRCSSVPTNHPSESLAGVMGVGAGVWCKHAAADKQIMLSLCCHGWQHTQRGAGALPERRLHPFSQGGGEGEHEGGLVLIVHGSQTPPPLLAGMHTAPVGGEREKKIGGGGNKQTHRGEVIRERKEFKECQTVCVSTVCDEDELMVADISSRYLSHKLVSQSPLAVQPLVPDVIRETVATLSIRTEKYRGIPVRLELVSDLELWPGG
ncbi:hypothetical protein Q5P01_024746 [Channa striata]|uniref:Uncharacterized protein n=1 Tax=Channa striata TaxID=64152 RepID=A0AA88J4N1_CHASR|nr:hypothetical protein Q5P01_024746 [Channa striata]